MTLLWVVATLDYYVVAFYQKYLPGSIYINTSVACLAELVAAFVAGFVLNLFGGRVAFIVCFCLSAIGAFLILFVPDSNVYFISFFVILMTFGNTFALSLCYLITA